MYWVSHNVCLQEEELTEDEQVEILPGLGKDVHSIINR